MWKYYALLSAFFAGLTAVLAKMGLQGISGNLATSIRTIVVLLMAWMIVFATGEQKQLASISRSSVLLLVLSGLATGFSWIFYFKALESGPVSKVAPIDKLSIAISIGLAFLFLGEQPDSKTLLGAILIISGSLILIR